MKLGEGRKEERQVIPHGCKSYLVAEPLMGINIMVKMANNIFLAFKGVLVAVTQSDMSEDYGPRYVLG